jgi:hypothetical protein
MGFVRSTRLVYRRRLVRSRPAETAGLLFPLSDFQALRGWGMEPEVSMIWRTLLVKEARSGGVPEPCSEYLSLLFALGLHSPIRVFGAPLLSPWCSRTK